MRTAANRHSIRISLGPALAVLRSDATALTDDCISDPRPTMTNGDFSASSFALCAGYISIVCIDRILSTHDIVKVTSC